MSESGIQSAAMHWFAELRRRRVIRVAVVYAAVGWGVIQVASTVLPPLDAPAWSVKLAIILVASGFPLAIFLAWLFGASSGGLLRAEDAPAPTPTAARPAIASRVGDGSTGKSTTGHDGRRSIAVLPFVNMSGDAGTKRCQGQFLWNKKVSGTISLPRAAAVVAQADKRGRSEMARV